METDSRVEQIRNEIYDASNAAGEDWFERLQDVSKTRVLSDGLANCEKAARKFLTALDAKDGRGLELLLHTGNKVLRRAFNRLTGTDLGKTEQAARDAVRQFVGPEAYDAQRAARQKEADDKDRAEQAKRDAAHAESIERIKAKFPTCVSGGELLDLARHFGIIVNLRVQGTLLRRVSEVKPETVRMSGNGNSIHVFRLREQVAECIAHSAAEVSVAS